MMRRILLAASQNAWLCTHVPRYRFVRRAVSRFMPGEEASDAFAAARALKEQGIRSAFTRLGENVMEAAEAESVTQHYLDVLSQIEALRLAAEVSVKLTQLGLDLDSELCYRNLLRIMARAGADSVVWIDMEASDYVDRTLALYRRARQHFRNVGVCLQSYLYRTADDLASLLPLGPAVRLVKGAYLEPPERAFPRKKDVDENFFYLSKQLLGPEARGAGVRTAVATHDLKLIRRIEGLAQSSGLANDSFQFQMLYGIQRAEQLRLAQAGWRSTVLISYGTYWYPWYMRRLAERPANLWFVARNMLAG
jgi:proline dehydrogenase